MSKKRPNLGPKVGDPPDVRTVTPSGADPAALEQLNPPPVGQDEHADDPDRDATPVLVRETNHNHVVEAKRGGNNGGTTTGPAADKEGTNDGAYEIFARSGAQQPGGPSMGANEPNNKHNDDVEGAEKIAAMMSHMPADTPRDHTVYGYGGYRLTIGDLRAIADSFDGGDSADQPASDEAQDDEEG